MFDWWFSLRRRMVPAVRAEVGVRPHVHEDDLLALDNGHYRAAFAVPGEPLDRASDDEALSFLQHLAYALNALPPGVVLMARREPGTERAHLAREKRRLDGGAVADALVPLRRARLEHLAGVAGGARRGTSRRVFVLAVDGATKTDATYRAAKIEGAFGPLGAVRLRGDALTDTLARRWRGVSCPPRDHFAILAIGQHELVYGPNGARTGRVVVPASAALAVRGG